MIIIYYLIYDLLINKMNKRFRGECKEKREYYQKINKIELKNK